MRHLLQLIGRAIWWCGWPVMWLYLRDSERTRLVLTNENGQVLLVKGWISANGRWSLPGGGLHSGEEPLGGLLREVREEIGLQLRKADVTPLEVRRIKSKGFRFNLYFFTASVTESPTIKLQWYEIAESAWFDISALSAVNTEPDVMSVISTLVHRA